MSPMKTGVMGGLFKDFGSVMTKKLVGWTDVGEGLFQSDLCHTFSPLFGDRSRETQGCNLCFFTDIVRRAALSFSLTQAQSSLAQRPSAVFLSKFSHAVRCKKMSEELSVCCVCCA